MNCHQAGYDTNIDVSEVMPWNAEHLRRYRLSDEYIGELNIGILHVVMAKAALVIYWLVMFGFPDRDPGKGDKV